MSKAVQFDDYGGIDVLEVRGGPRPKAGPGQVLVAVRAAALGGMVVIAVSSGWWAWLQARPDRGPGAGAATSLDPGDSAIT